MVDISQNKPFEYYIDLNRKLHQSNKKYGKGDKHFNANRAISIFRHYKIKSVLDYGCGKGRLVSGLELHYDAVGYDPAVERYAEEPTGTFDAVTCIDVLEHIPEHLLSIAFDDFKKYAQKLLVVSIALRLAGKITADGNNAHLTIREPDWWLDNWLSKDFDVKPKISGGKLFVVGVPKAVQGVNPEQK